MKSKLKVQNKIIILIMSLLLILGMGISYVTNNLIPALIASIVLIGGLTFWNK